jgi:hypothetical protein
MTNTGHARGRVVLVAICTLAGCITIEQQGDDDATDPPMMGSNGGDLGPDAGTMPMMEPEPEGVPVGQQCSDRGVCTDKGNCVYNPTAIQATCRVMCDPAAPQCDGGTWCLTFSDGSGACVPQPDAMSQWSVTIVDAKVSTTLHPDPSSGAPDPYVYFWAYDARHQTTPVTDAYVATWNTPFPSTWPADALGYPFIQLRDYDGAGAWETISEWLDSIAPYWAGEKHRYQLKRLYGELTIELTPH